MPFLIVTGAALLQCFASIYPLPSHDSCKGCLEPNGTCYLFGNLQDGGLPQKHARRLYKYIHLKNLNNEVKIQEVGK
jgi:hypothetical protein